MTFQEQLLAELERSQKQEIEDAYAEGWGDGKSTTSADGDWTPDWDASQAKQVSEEEDD